MFLFINKIFADGPHTDRSRDNPGTERPYIKQTYICDADPKMTVDTISSCQDITCWDGVTKAKLYRQCPANTGNTDYSQVCKTRAQNSRSCIEYYTQSDMDNLSATVNFNLLMSDIMKNYKQLSANFIEDNDSISSIPRNLASLQARHINWTIHIKKVFTENKIDFESITDSNSYQIIVNKINTMVSTLFPDDSGLSITENKFTSDVMNIHDELSTLKTRLNGLLNDSLIDKAIAFSGDKVKELDTNLITMSKNISITMQGLNNVRIIITEQQLIRKKMKNYTSELWIATANKALGIHNMNEANDLIMQMKKSLTSPKVYAQMLNDLDRHNMSVQNYFSTYYAPLLARRAVFGYWQNALDYQNKVANSEDIDPLYKQQMQFRLDTVLNLIPSFVAKATNTLEKSDQYLNQRKKNIQTRIKLLDSDNKKLITSCQVLSETILNDTLPTSTISSEENYVEFRKNCWQGVEK